jgi:AcrR family transcriptional regulator
MKPCSISQGCRNSMPKRSEAYMTERRQQIVDALERCLAREGWDRATIDEVAREAGLSKGAVYVHFASKRMLLIGMLDRELVELDRLSGSEDLATLRRLTNDSLARLARKDGWRIASGRAEAWIQGGRDPEIRAKLAAGSARAMAGLTSMARRLSPGLGAQEAKLWALKFLALTNGLAAMGSFSFTIDRKDIDILIRRHIDDLVEL